MKIPIYALGFGFVLSVTALTAQAPQQQQPTTPVSPSTPATQVGDGAQGKAGTPVQPTTTVPATTGGVAGAASPDAQEGAGGISAMTDSDLQGQIQNALSKEPTLTGDSPRVNVSGDTVELAGAVGTNKEKITATRIVQSYTGSKKLVNKLTISPRSEKSSTDNSGSTANPANNPEPNKGTRPAGSKPPQR